MKAKIKKAVKGLRESNERGARTSLIEELFYDFHRSRAQVYSMNFVRGVLFGAGSVIGGTLVIASVIWVLTLLGHVVPPLGDFFNSISDTLQNRSR